MNPSPQEILATVLFACAVLHTFCVKRFAKWSHHYPEGSIGENLFHFLAETEVVFGLWATLLVIGLAILHGSVHHAVEYIEGLHLNFTEPKFVFVVMVVAATRPIVNLAEAVILWIARLLPFKENASFFIAALSFGPLFGSFITEPAAMTLLALLLKRRYFDRDIGKTLAYGAIGLLFVNVSIGGTLTHFAAPPVLMVATPWKWDMVFMATHFGWRAVASCLCSTLVFSLVFWRQLNAVEADTTKPALIPFWLTSLHLMFLGLVVGFAHHPDFFFGIFMIFLGLVTATREYQDSLKLREGLLVGFFLAGLVTLGKMQSWWLDPLINNPQMTDDKLYFGATALTAITDNAALTYLGTQVEGLSDGLKYALVAGAVTGGGLTVIANAPNPAGAGIIQGARVFENEGLSPIGLLIGALPPTAIAILFFWVLP